MSENETCRRFQQRKMKEKHKYKIQEYIQTF